MILYINSFNYDRISFEDLDVYNYENEIIFITNNGIYKKYKQHFYKLNNETINSKEQKTLGVNIVLQEKPYEIIKENPLTYIDYEHYLINRKILSVIIDDSIEFKKEIDNDVILSYYFVLKDDINIETAIEKIGLFLNKNLIE